MWGVSLAIFSGSLVAFLLWSQHLEPSAEEAARIAGLARLEPSVARLARNGLGGLSEAWRVAELSTPNGSALAELIAAWMRLSLGRLHIFTLATCSRLPWLVATALSPWLLFVALRRSSGLTRAVLAAFVLGASLFSHGPSSIATPVGSNVGWGMLVLAPYTRTWGTSNAADVTSASIVTALCFALALGAAPALGWLALICTVHWAIAHGFSARAAIRRGRLLIPSFVLLAVPIAVLGFVASHGGLWGDPAGASATQILVQLDGSPARLEPWKQSGTDGAFGSPIWLSWAAAAGLVGLVGRSVQRRLAESRSLADPPGEQAIGALALVGTFLVWGLRLLLSPSRAAPPAELAWPFAAALAVLGLAALVQMGRGLRRTAADTRAQSA